MHQRRLGRRSGEIFAEDLTHPSRFSYAARVLFRLGRRIVGMVTGFFALLGFIAVPIGDRTAYEHVKAFLDTPEGRETTAALSRTVATAQSRLLAWVTERLGISSVTEAIQDRTHHESLPQAPEGKRKPTEIASH